MRAYDFKRAKQFITDSKKPIRDAHMGMYEDWFWTATKIYDGEKFTEDLDNPELKQFPDIPSEKMP